MQIFRNLRAAHKMQRKIYHGSTTSSNSRMLRIMTSNPIVTMTSSAKPNQPKIIAVVPTPLRTLPLPRSCAT